MGKPRCLATKQEETGPSRARSGEETPPLSSPSTASFRSRTRSSPGRASKGLCRGSTFDSLCAFEDTPFICLFDFGACCCSPNNDKCSDHTSKLCKTFGAASHKCEKTRHLVYNRTKRARKKAAASSSKAAKGKSSAASAASSSTSASSSAASSS